MTGYPGVQLSPPVSITGLKFVDDVFAESPAAEESRLSPWRPAENVGRGASRFMVNL